MGVYGEGNGEGECWGVRGIRNGERMITGNRKSGGKNIEMWREEIGVNGILIHVNFYGKLKLFSILYFRGFLSFLFYFLLFFFLSYLLEYLQVCL